MRTGHSILPCLQYTRGTIDPLGVVRLKAHENRFAQAERSSEDATAAMEQLRHERDALEAALAEANEQAAADETSRARLVADLAQQKKATVALQAELEALKLTQKFLGHSGRVSQDKMDLMKVTNDVLAQVIIAPGRYCPWSLLPLVAIAPGRYCPWSLLPLVAIAPGRYCPWSLLPLVAIAPGRYCPWSLLPLVAIAPGRYCPWSLLPLVAIAPGRYCPWSLLPLLSAVRDEKAALEQEVKALRFANLQGRVQETIRPREVAMVAEDRLSDADLTAKLLRRNLQQLTATTLVPAPAPPTPATLLGRPAEKLAATPLRAGVGAGATSTVAATNALIDSLLTSQMLPPPPPQLSQPLQQRQQSPAILPSTEGTTTTPASALERLAAVLGGNASTLGLAFAGGGPTGLACSARFPNADALDAKPTGVVAPFCINKLPTWSSLVGGGWGLAETIH
ncbi:hypothetical protein PAPYR_7357 [Paratrimastix pyriformis]|uniref:Uncharacterized protein n=1 Tax=Paratrimastix pyriformis TaxID=342808 RepID=A0ABQ8UFP9_9EUKA|nr:hypothetical protein PAPYR_7357 [Paratrimastix pyriformis]